SLYHDGAGPAQGRAAFPIPRDPKQEMIMPLTLTLTEGVVPKGQEKVAFSRLSEAMIRWHGLSGNKVMTPNVVGSLHVLPKDATFTGMEETAVAFVEWKVPSFAFTDPKIQQ